MARKPAVSAGLAAAFASLAFATAAAACTTGPTPDRAPPSRRPHAAGRLSIAGSGGALILAKRLADDYRSSRPAVDVVVLPSIGSSGGVRALVDGAIDVALLSRELRPNERNHKLRVVPFATTQITLVAHRNVQTDAVDLASLPSLFAGNARWPTGGRAVPVLRESGDTSQERLATLVPSLAGVLTRLWRGDRYRVAYHDAQLTSAVASLPGAFGALDAGQVSCGSLDLHVVTIRAAGREPLLVKELAFALPEHARADAVAFVQFATGERGREIVRRCGYGTPGRR